MSENCGKIENVVENKEKNKKSLRTSICSHFYFAESSEKPQREERSKVNPIIIWILYI